MQPKPDRYPLPRPKYPFHPPPPPHPRRPSGPPAGEPIFLSSEVAIAQNSLANLDSQSLMSPRKVPMYIDELSFLLLGASQMAGGAIGAMLKLGTIQITNNFVPVWCFDRRFDSGLEHLGERATNSFDGIYRWRLDEPLYVPPGAALNGVLQQFGFASGGAATAVVGVYGREMPPGHMPAKLSIPFATAYVSPQFAGDAAGTDNSAPVALSNTTGKLVRVNRIVGRLLVAATTVGVDATAPVFNDSGLADMGGTLVRLQMWHSSGHPILRTYTPFLAAFSAAGASVTVPHDMDPRAFYSVRVDKQATTTVYNTTTELGPSCQVQVAIVGTREA